MEESKFDIKSGRQAMKEQQEFMEGMIKRRFEEGDIDFRDEIDDMLDNIEEEQKLLANESGPGKDDTIH